MNRAERDVSGVSIGIGHQGATRYGSSQKDGRTDLLRAQAAEGANANFCPFGCYDDELDEQGYCFHLIGFSPDGKKLERNEVGEDGRVRTKAPIQKVNGRFTIVHDERVDRRKHVLVPVVKGGTSRVYENVPRPEDYPEPVSDELSDEELAAIDAEEDAIDAGAEVEGDDGPIEQAPGRQRRGRRRQSPGPEVAQE